MDMRSQQARLAQADSNDRIWRCLEIDQQGVNILAWQLHRRIHDSRGAPQPMNKEIEDCWRWILTFYKDIWGCPREHWCHGSSLCPICAILWEQNLVNLKFNWEAQYWSAHSEMTVEIHCGCTNQDIMAGTEKSSVAYPVACNLRVYKTTFLS